MNNNQIEMVNFKEALVEIQAFVFDVDGVFTDAQITLASDGEYLRQYNMRDGLAVVQAVKKGYAVAVISGGEGQQLERRMRSLGIRHIYLKQENKVEALLDFSKQSGVALSRVIYTGDDYPDLAPMRRVRLAVAPADAADDVKAAVHYVSGFRGGRGCVRDVIEQVLRARGDWFEIEK